MVESPKPEHIVSKQMQEPCVHVWGEPKDFGTIRQCVRCGIKKKVENVTDSSISA